MCWKDTLKKHKNLRLDLLMAQNMSSRDNNTLTSRPKKKDFFLNKIFDTHTSRAEEHFLPNGVWHSRKWKMIFFSVSWSKYKQVFLSLCTYLT